MADPAKILHQKISLAVQAALGEALPNTASVHPSVHADYQADVALGLAKRTGRPPREVAEAIVRNLDVNGLCESVAIAGPGFINLKLSGNYLSAALAAMAASHRLDVPRPTTVDRIVIDYSSPNVAKEMHVGHLRSTIIGDALVRILSFVGHEVIRQNHMGDWGTPFGMLIERLVECGNTQGDANIADLNAFYQEARARFDGDAEFADRARQRVVQLQAGDAATLALWHQLVRVSLVHINEVYRRLHVLLQPEDIVPESFYNPQLPGLVADLQAKGLTEESDGALCVFPPGFTGHDDAPVPLIVRKQDGGFGYATTDLAALRHRLGTLLAGQVLVVVGSPQSQHLAMVFKVAQMAGWAESGQATHVAFGSVLGAEKKMLKTRAGTTIKLLDLIDESRSRARQVIEGRLGEMTATQISDTAEAIGVAAIKYADLASDRIKDYVFDWDKMLAFDGNTAPYLMYAHARIQSILRKGEVTPAAASQFSIVIETAEERKVALLLLQFEAVVEKTSKSLQPHRLCSYLYELSSAFTGFYENCPVLKAEPAQRHSRLGLAALSARVLAQGLDLLGIAAPDAM